MVRVSAIIEDEMIDILEDFFCELNRSSWGLEKRNDFTPAEVFGYFDSESEAIEKYNELRKEFSNLSENFELENINDCDWQNEYKKFLTPWNYENLHWIPIWEKNTYKFPSGDKAFYFDAGLAFGTGDHPTTRLCAKRMIEYINKVGEAEKKFLIDAGCGSGILGLSAKLLGFGKILCFDRDEEAVRVTLENAKFNEISLDKVSVEYAGIERGLADNKCDIMLANIQSDVLAIYADNLINAIKPNGWLVLSGILGVENENVKKLFIKKAGDRLVSCENEFMGEWSDLKIVLR